MATAMLFSSSDLAYSLSPPGLLLESTSLTLRIALALSNTLLRIELVSEHDLGKPAAGEAAACFYYLAEITPSAFAQIKREQTLRVDFVSFSHQLVRLVGKCVLQSTAAAGDSSTSHRLGITSDGSDSKIQLSVLETTSFRELAHVTLQLQRASEAQCRLYLYSRLETELARSAQLEHAAGELEERVAAQHEADLALVIKQASERAQQEADGRVKQVEAELLGAQQQAMQREHNAHAAKLAEVERDRDALLVSESALRRQVAELEQAKSELLSSSSSSSLQVDDRLTRKNKVIKEQERAVVALERDLALERTRAREWEQQVHAEQAKSAELAQQISVLRQRLEISRSTLEENQSLISLLQQQQQHHRSY